MCRFIYYGINKENRNKNMFYLIKYKTTTLQ